MEIIIVIATIGLFIVGAIQVWILKKQTNIQENQIKIALLQQRINCFNIINDARAELLYHKGPIALLEGYLDSTKMDKNLNKILSMYLDFHKVVVLSKYLFNEQIYTTLVEIGKIFDIYKDKLSLYVFAILEESNKIQQNPTILSPYHKFALEIHTNPAIINDEKKMREKYISCFGKIAEEVFLLEDQLRDYANNEDFFNMFDKYINVQDLGK